MTEKHPERLHLKLHPALADRMRKYAKANGLKLAVVVKQGFELLEDHPELVARKDPRDPQGW